MPEALAGAASPAETLNRHAGLVLEKIDWNTEDGVLLQRSPDDKRLVIMVIMGTRPEVIQLRRISHWRIVVVSTGQHRELLQQAMDIFGDQINADVALDVRACNQPLSSLGAKILLEVDKLIQEWHPHLLLVQGDTTTAHMSGLAAFHRGVPVGHVEAGLRTYDIHQPFPEELNRQALSNIASFHFAATPNAAHNLGRGRRHVYVTGNTVVDAQQIVLRKISQSQKSGLQMLAFMQLVSKHTGKSPVWCLLTMHRRESFGNSMDKILRAIVRLLHENSNLFILFPVHPNPAVRAAITRMWPKSTIRNRPSDIHDLDFQERIFLVEPLGYSDLLYFMNRSHFILTDSGGIQEEAASLGRPTLVLRDNTERVEGVLAGTACLVGSDFDKIVSQGNLLAQNATMREYMALRGKGIYGSGDAASKIVNIIRENSDALLRGQITWSQWHTNITPPGEPYGSSHALLVTHKDTEMEDLKKRLAAVEKQLAEEKLRTECEFVVVITVWKRKTLNDQLGMLEEQKMAQCMIRQVFVFQNGDHLDVTGIIFQWKQRHTKMNIVHIQSKIQTGYYGRFLVPLLDHQRSNSQLYFAILDDDVIFGSRYFENCKRVVDDKDALCTRNGRFVQQIGGGSWKEHLGSSPNGWLYDGQPATWDRDVFYDYGGHIWIGKLSWLRILWRHPPPLLDSSEDFWISAVLKTSMNISTVRPRCQSPKVGGDLQLCACSMKVAKMTEPFELGGNQQIPASAVSSPSYPAFRGEMLRRMMHHFPTLKTIPMIDPAFDQHEAAHYVFPDPKSIDAHKVQETRFADCMWFM